MNIIIAETIRLKAEVVNKVDAVIQSGELLVNAGYVAQEYIDGMVAREKILSNYLGSGIAIPHGRQEDLKDVYHTGISVLQIPKGVDWEVGEKAYLVFGIAAKSSDHYGILSNIMALLSDTKGIQELVQTNDPNLIIKRLTQK